jgi:hypothetical protein
MVVLLRRDSFHSIMPFLSLHLPFEYNSFAKHLAKQRNTLNHCYPFSRPILYHLWLLFVLRNNYPKLAYYSHHCPFLIHVIYIFVLDVVFRFRLCVKIVEIGKDMLFSSKGTVLILRCRKHGFDFKESLKETCLPVLPKPCISPRAFKSLIAIRRS